MSDLGAITVTLKGPLFDGTLERELARRLRIAMSASLARVEATAARNTPVNLGLLRSSLTSESEEHGAVGGGLPSTMIGRVGSPLVYAEYVEGGRRPGQRMPPEAPIEAWVRRKLRPKAEPAPKGTRRKKGAALAARERAIRTATFLVRRAIARRGIEGKHMLRDACRQEEPWVQRAFAAAARIS